MLRFLLSLFFFFTLPIFAQNTILIMGDSLSAGYGIDVNESWPQLLKNRLNESGLRIEVVNASISGETTSGALQRLPHLLLSHKPMLTIIELGGNDGLRGLSPIIIEKNLLQMIVLVKAAKSKVLILGVRLPPNYGAEYLQAFAKIFQHLSKDSDIHVFPLFLTGIDENKAYMQADQLHPNQQAQSKLLDNIWPSIFSLIK